MSDLREIEDKIFLSADELENLRRVLRGEAARRMAWTPLFAS